MSPPTPEVIRLSPAEFDTLVEELRAHLPARLFELVHGVLQTLQWVLAALELKTTTIARLQRVLFGSRSEKASHLYPEKPSAQAAAEPASTPPAPKPKRRGHGRRPARTYTGARQVSIPHPQLQAGGPCPDCGGRLSDRTPAQVVVIQAQPVFQATRYQAQALRCNRCQKLFQAPWPAEARGPKYDSSVGDTLGLQRFGLGVPMYRTARWQQDAGVPLPASTQWELMAAAARPREPIFEALIQAAAQAPLLHTDDTQMRVQSLRRQIVQQGADASRTGIFTTSVVADLGEHQVALYFTGAQHAGENLDDVLRRRPGGLCHPLHMCDALSRNPSKEFETILCNCLTHGRRNFTDVRESFPEECRHVVESLGEVYGHDAQARQQNLSAEERLRLHQEHSQPILDRLHKWMTEQLDQKRVEPNSGLGQAIGYMLKRWEALTRFLKIPGAPLDNNIAERALKFAILHRKNSLSFKTERGAKVGDFFLSVIQTCRLNRANPCEYFQALRDHAALALRNPSAWLPWNFRQTLDVLNAAAPAPDSS